MTRHGLIILLLSGLCATLALARPGVVKTRDGQTYEGDIDDKDPEAVVVNTKGIQTRIERSRIASIDYAQDFSKQFADRMAKLGPKDVNGRLLLARQAFDQKNYLLARDAAESALAIDPNNAQAVAMLDTIRSQMRMEKAKQQPATPDAQPKPEAATEPSTTQSAGDHKVLKPAEINAMRLAELRSDDHNVRIRFDHDVKRRFISYANLPPAEFNSLTPNMQVQKIVREGTPEMRQDIQVLNDPPAIFQYRRQVQPFLLQNCATSGCHGGQGPGKFSLISPADSDAAAATNFYILQRYAKGSQSTSNSVFGPGEMRVIDRQHPEKSLLLQYAMPGAIAEFDHPDVPGYKPSLRGPTDLRYRQILDWIGGSLQPVEPDYGFDFNVPGSSSATKPVASQPTTAPK